MPCCLSSPLRWFCLTYCITLCILRFLHAAKTRSRLLRDGRERPHELFGRQEAEKVGSLPPNLVLFSVSLFSFSCRSFPRFAETYANHKEKKMVKTKLKCVIPTFFTCFPQILTARIERSFLLGCATTGPLGTCLIAKVTARVTDMVIRVFHAPVTFPRCK